MAYLKFKDENNQWQDLPAIRGRDGAIQYQAGNGIVIEDDTISAIQQDLSNYYTKSEVNGLIAAVETVSLDVEEELPATGEPNVIYLVPSSNPATQNAMDEYIYVDNAWEQIGSTAIDMSNYYTKAEVDNKTSSYNYIYVDCSGLTINNTYIGDAQYIQYDIPNTVKNKLITDFNALINASVNKRNIVIVLRNLPTWQSNEFDFKGGTLELYPNLTDDKPSGSGAVFFYVSYPIRPLMVNIWKNTLKSSYMQYQILIESNSSHQDETADGVQGIFGWLFREKQIFLESDTAYNNFLAKANTTSFTPSGDYNPATKKYVDDAVAGAGGVTQADLLKRGIYVRCDSQLNTASTTSLSNAAIAELQAGLQAAYDAGLSTVDITLAFKTNNSNTLGYMSYQVYHLRLHSGIHLIGKPTDMHYLDFNANTTTFADAAPIRKFQLVISATWSGNTITVTRAEYRLVQRTIMFLDNTYTYTPTENYHPASKKYVDDSISAIPIPTATEQRVIYIDISSTYTGVLNGNHTYSDIQLSTDELAALNALDNIEDAVIIVKTAYDHVLLNAQSKGTSLGNNIYCYTFRGMAWRYNTTFMTGDPIYTPCTLCIKYTQNPETLTGYIDFISINRNLALVSELHTHSNKTTLDTITAQNITDWSSAVTDSHTHTNKTVLDGISSSDITNWNKVHIYSGTSTPGAGTGENGDIYVKYTA